MDSSCSLRRSSAELGVVCAVIIVGVTVPWLPGLDRTLQTALSHTHPQLALVVKSVEQFDNVLVVTGGQDVDLHHVVLQLFLGLRVNNFGSSEDARLLVLSLQG